MGTGVGWMGVSVSVVVVGRGRGGLEDWWGVSAAHSTRHPTSARAFPINTPSACQVAPAGVYPPTNSQYAWQYPAFPADPSRMYPASQPPYPMHPDLSQFPDYTQVCVRLPSIAIAAFLSYLICLCFPVSPMCRGSTVVPGSR